MSLADELQKLEELRRSGALTEWEFAKAKQRLLEGPPPASAASTAPAQDPNLGQHLAEQLAEVKYQNELARIDREWDMERENYMVADRWGRKHIPSTGMGLAAAIVGGVFGVFWTIFAISITGGAPDEGPFSIAKVIFPLFGVVFIVSAVGYGIYCMNRAGRYQKAYEQYLWRKGQIRPEDFR